MTQVKDTEKISWQRNVSQTSDNEWKKDRDSSGKKKRERSLRNLFSLENKLLPFLFWRKRNGLLNRQTDKRCSRCSLCNLCFSALSLPSTQANHGWWNLRSIGVHQRQWTRWICSSSQDNPCLCHWKRVVCWLQDPRCFCSIQSLFHWLHRRNWTENFPF